MVAFSSITAWITLRTIVSFCGATACSLVKDVGVSAACAFTHFRAGITVGAFAGGIATDFAIICGTSIITPVVKGLARDGAAFIVLIASVSCIQRVFWQALVALPPVRTMGFSGFLVASRAVAIVVECALSLFNGAILDTLGAHPLPRGPVRLQMGIFVAFACELH